MQRGECINGGVILYSKRLKFLGARIHLDRERLLRLCPEADYDGILAHLKIREGVASGDERYGTNATMELSSRFGWLVSPTSTIIQPSETHTGLCEDAEAELEHLFRLLVL